MCIRDRFKTSVRDLVAKLKIFRYEGDRRLRLIADYAHARSAAAYSSGGISGRIFHRDAGRATAVAPTPLSSITRALHRRVARRMDRAPVAGATHLPGACDGDANALTHESQHHCRSPSARLLQWLPAPAICRPFLDTKCSPPLKQQTSFPSITATRGCRSACLRVCHLRPSQHRASSC